MMTRDIRINVPAGVPALPSEHLQELPVRAAKKHRISLHQLNS